MTQKGVTQHNSIKYNNCALCMLRRNRFNDGPFWAWSLHQDEIRSQPKCDHCAGITSTSETPQKPSNGKAAKPKAPTSTPQ